MARFFNIVAIASVVASARAYDIGGGVDIGGYGGMGGGDGGMMGGMMGGGGGMGGMGMGMGGGDGGYGGMLGGDGGYGYGHYDPHYEAAIHSKRHVSVVPVQEKYEEPKVHSVNVEPAEMPLVLNLKSKSSPLIVNAMHIGEGKGSLKKTKSVDAPHIRVHETLKPVLQEVREVVQPHRKIVQFISPVVQRINTFVTHGHHGHHGHGYGGHEQAYFGPGHMGGGMEGEGGIGGGIGGGNGGGLGGGIGGGYGGGIGGGLGGGMGGGLGSGMGGGMGGGDGGVIGGLGEGGYEKGGEMMGGYSRSIKKIALVGRKFMPSPKIAKRGYRY